MSSPGEMMAQTMQTARRSLDHLSKSELLEYKALIEGIASNERYAFVDERMSGLTAEGKLLAIDEVLKKYQE